MKKGYRLKPSNAGNDFAALYVGLIFFGMMYAFFAIITHYTAGVFAEICVLLVFLFVYGIYAYTMLKCGVFLVGTKIVFKKVFKEEEIPLDKIKAIKIVHEFFAVKPELGSYQAMFDKNNNPVFLMFFLSKTEVGMNTRVWDSNRFKASFSDSILFQCVYDEELLQYLISLNPNIERM